ncbi:hypothetical protein QYE76_048596 [Lolium multiflorum]|uniref:F-box domain-containing protein n=1 Tax=Lolium multiflorum TaxID=4521 RepID=A0AAD8SMY3_LOLMU|nr:hypothetical protein QYE76_048596 [Lolium multiflorum]
MLREATAVSLPDDTIFDILSRTPASSLRRFRCVCKEWRALISDPFFLAAHKSRRPELLLVGTDYFRGYKERDLQLRDLSGNVVKLIQGVGGSDILPMTNIDDGIVCVIDGPCKAVRVVDLATGEVLSTIHGVEVRKRMHCFVRRQYETFGIGRTASSGVYKVVRVVLGDTCQVLTLGVDTTWRMKTHSVTNCVLDANCSPVTINGVMYFLTQGTSSTLLCFDLENEQWNNQPIKGPWEQFSAEMYSTISLCITELSGFLCVVQKKCINVHMFLPQHDSSTNVWILDGLHKSNWTKMYTIPAGISCGIHMPLRVMHGGDKFLVQRVSTYPSGLSSLQLYDPCTKKCADLTGKLGYLSDNIVLCNMHLKHLVSVKKQFTLV